jgi:hypothetical protein
MRHVARALLNTAAFFELVQDDVLDPSSALKVLEDIAAELSDATAEERAILKAAASELAAEARQAGPAFAGQAHFFSSFLYSVGLEHEPPTPP